MKPTMDHYIQAVRRLGMLAYFPPDAFAQKDIALLLSRIVGTVEQLDWLVRTMLDRVGEWKGPKELRGVFCTRFKPADGIEADCSVSGFTAEAGEVKYQELQTAARKRLPVGIERLMIEGHISPEDAAESERARLEAYAALAKVKVMPDAKPIQLVTVKHPDGPSEFRRPITEADFEALWRKS